MDTIHAPLARTINDPASDTRTPSARSGRLSGVLLAAVPTVAFVAVNAVSSLTPALIAAAMVALATSAWRIHRRQSVKQAGIGLLVVTTCAVVAAVTGQARGFFLVPALIPFAVIAVCAGSLLIGRPLTGVVLNRISGGPADWRDVARLKRVYVVSTLVCIAVNVVNGAIQVIFYRANDTIVLAIAHVATGPIFASIVAVTIVVVRRSLAAE